jgi:alpha-tubulin suppressor-like RCC1 family protein
MLASGSGITQLSAGWGHMLALKSNGTVLAWGSNQVGQLGNGTRHTVPYLVGL